MSTLKDCKLTGLQPLETYFTKPDALTPFTFILVVLPIHPEILAKISHHAATTNTPAFYIHSTGFYAHITTQLPQAFPIVDTHPDPTSISDLRLLEPWPELHSLSRERTLGLEQMSDEEHGHVPYVHLLLHYLEAWKLSHGGIPPTDYRDKLEFRNMVQEGARAMTAEGGEENYEEAAGAVLKTLSPHRPSPDVKAVFAATECTRLSGNVRSQVAARPFLISVLTFISYSLLRSGLSLRLCPRSTTNMASFLYLALCPI